MESIIHLKYLSMQVRAASVLFVDNPVGTGYSYTDTEDALTKDVQWWHQTWWSSSRAFFL